MLTPAFLAALTVVGGAVVAGWSSMTGANGSISGDSLVWAVDGASSAAGVKSNPKHGSGKYHFSVVVTTLGAGEATLLVGLTGTSNLITFSNAGAGFYLANGIPSAFPTMPAFVAGDEVGFSYDADSGKLWMRVNGVYPDGADPVAGTGELITIAAGDSYAPNASIANQSGGTTSLHGYFGGEAFPFPLPTGYSSWDGSQTGT